MSPSSATSGSGDTGQSEKVSQSTQSTNPSGSTPSTDGDPEQSQESLHSHTVQNRAVSRTHGDLAVGLYPSLPESPEGHQCILYCYSVDLQRILLVSCVNPHPEEWGKLVRQWVEEHGPPTDLIYDL